MNLITREELKEKLDRGDDFKLVMVLNEWAYRAKHIPGSIHLDTTAEALRVLENGWQAFLGKHMPKVVDMEEFQAAMGWNMQNTPAVAERFRDSGYVVLSGGITSIPFEYFCGGRSMSKFYLDLYRMPRPDQAGHGCHRAGANRRWHRPGQGIRCSGRLGRWLAGGQRAGGAQDLG